ncbi:transposase domain-containing protein [Fimbriiglobus ruber]|uniref:Transposase IS4 N-terminal domain-containing protein n=1 Tax=Fimbriiglobus ruber TaxID=1908690 RepID=A0A225DMC0_9BACT|nr:transposase domain-containing protein [Fimbriiglobus ruber]OWK37337.1 hypothetical protein FRUB_06457 [Fimbriiglobus ruber]
MHAGFTRAQKCWAHLIRKAIKLTTQDPGRAVFRTLTDGLLGLDREAGRVQRDGRLSAAGRVAKVAALNTRLFDLVRDDYLAHLETPPSKDVENEYRLLVNERVRLLAARELFTFVEADPIPQIDGTTAAVPGTNNEAERTLRDTATARKTGRTNKTITGARRRTIRTTVLESLRRYLPTFALADVLAELTRWSDRGRSCFAEHVAQCQFTVPEGSVLDPIPFVLAQAPAPCYLVFAKTSGLREAGSMRPHGGCIASESETVILDRLAGLTKIISPEVIEQALSDSDRVGQRRCQLSHRTMLWVVLAMGLLTHLPLRQVFKYARRMTRGEQTPARSSLCEGRQRLGVDAVRSVFEQVVRPLATPSTPGAFYQGFRLMAIDGTVQDVPDTPANAAHFGRSRGDAATAPSRSCGR